MNRWPAMAACVLRDRPASYLIAALAGAILYGCAQLERAPEPAQPTPAASTPESSTPESSTPEASAPAPPAPAQTVPPPPVQPSSGDAATSSQERGRISMYDSKFSGRKTASGEPFDPTALTMAHRTLPFGTRVRITNLENQRSVEVVVNDRGPFVSGRIADLSIAAARRIGMVSDGVVEALLEILQPAKRR